MKKGLVLFPCDDHTRQRLQAAAVDRCEFVFKEPDWPDATYREALADANIIIGEPRNEDFQYCRQLELMQSPSSGVNYYAGGGCFP